MLLRQKPSSKGHIAHHYSAHAVPKAEELRDVKAVQRVKAAENRKRQLRIREAQIQRQQKLKHDLTHLI